MFSAKALYNNAADSAEELSFSKGDVLEVVEKDDVSGWWLCRLKGKTGIAPGNRLQVMAPAAAAATATDGSRSSSPSGRNSPAHKQLPPPVSNAPRNATQNSTPTAAAVADQNARPNWHQNNKVIVPKKAGNMYTYDASNQAQQDYDVPPSRHQMPPSGGTIASALSNKSDAFQNYDVPSSIRGSASPATHPGDDYDTLPALTRTTSDAPDAGPSKSSSLLIYDIPPSYLTTPGVESDPASSSNRLSVLSVMSTGSQSSFCSGHSSRSGSVSARSSMDASFQDVYDVPPSSRFLMAGSETGRHLHPVIEQCAGSSISATPMRTHPKHCVSVTSPSAERAELMRQNLAGGPPSSLKLQVERDSLLEDYSIPRSDVSQGSGDSGISLSQTSTGGETYDTPRKLLEPDITLTKSDECATYDVPNQVICGMNDSMERPLTNGLNFMDLSLTGCAVTAMMSNPVKVFSALQSSVLGQGSQLVVLIDKAFLGNEERELPQIKLKCLALRTALQELMEFGNSVFARSINHRNEEDPSYKASLLLDKIRVQCRFFHRHVERLLTTQWPAKQLDRAPGEISDLDDNLNTVRLLAEAILGHVMTMTKFVSQNLSSLFACGPVSSEAMNNDLGSVGDDRERSNAPLSPAIEDKPKLAQRFAEKQSHVQCRPLPPVPSQTSANICDNRSLKHQSINSTMSGAMPSGVGDNCRYPAGISSDWNDDCDYVSIANEAEKEMKAQAEERLFGQQAPDGTATCDKLAEPTADNATTRENCLSDGTLRRNEINGVKTVLNENPQSVHSGSDFSGNGGGYVRSGDSAVCGSASDDLMIYYAGQIESNYMVVETAVREFFQMLVSDRVTAKEFLLRSKYVILAAHKLVYIGDTITRNSAGPAGRNGDEVALKANSLCNILKETVSTTKTSALNYPQNVAQQKLVECMRAVLQASSHLCQAIRANVE